MVDMTTKQNQQRLWAMRSASAKQLAAAAAAASSARGSSGGGGQQPSLPSGPDRDYSTELLLRDAMYPAMRQAMYPSLKLPELSADAGNISASPAQTASDLRWPQHQQPPPPPQQGSAWPAGQYGEGIPEYGNHSGQTAAGGAGSSFFERAFMGGHGGGEASRPSVLARGWHANSTPALVGLENSNVAAAAAAAAAAAPGPGQGPLSPRQWQTGPAWDQMPASWHPDSGFSGVAGAGGGGEMGSMYGGPGVMAQRDMAENFPGSAGAAALQGGNAWLRGGSHPQLGGLARNSRGVYVGSGGNMQALVRSLSLHDCSLLLIDERFQTCLIACHASEIEHV